MFNRPVPLQDGIYRALTHKPRLPLAQQSNFLPLTAKLYEPLWRQRSLSIITRGEYSTRRELELMLAWLNTSANQTVLDAACSAGLYARTLNAHTPGLSVHALDYSLAFLNVAKKHQDAAALTLVHGQVEDLPYVDACFDAVACGGSLNEFVSLEACCAEFSRVLKPGGKLWLMYLRPANTLLAKALQGLIRASGVRFVAPETLQAICQAQGLRPVRAEHRGVVVMSLFIKDN